MQIVRFPIFRNLSIFTFRIYEQTGHVCALVLQIRGFCTANVQQSKREWQKGIL
jgi:hypothetical protein